MTKTDITCSRADTAKWMLTAKDPDNNEIDLTGGKVVFAARRSPADAVLFELTSNPGGGIVIRDQVTDLGVADIKLRSADTLQLANQDVQLFYTIHVFTSGGDEFCVVSGTLTVSAIA